MPGVQRLERTAVASGHGAHQDGVARLVVGGVGHGCHCGPVGRCPHSVQNGIVTRASRAPALPAGTAPPALVVLR
ncbi:MAG: hypothetical protein ABI807_06245, partial [Sporichthyaceae bacterium]